VPSDEEHQAAAAARRAERRNREIPNVALRCHSIGACPDCGARFNYNRPGDEVLATDPCPDCTSTRWHNWGYRYNGEEIRRDKAWDEKSPPPGCRNGSHNGDGDG